MCSAQNFTDFRGVTGKIEFDQAIPVKRLLRLENKMPAPRRQCCFIIAGRTEASCTSRSCNDPYGLKNQVLALANQWHSRGHANITFCRK